MPINSALNSAVHWGAWNLGAHAVRFKNDSRRSALIKYEDFAARPEQAVTGITNLLGEKTGGSPFVGERKVALSTNHTISGNPDRLLSGTVEVKEDSRWRTLMPKNDRLITTSLMLPLLLHYRYPIILRR